MTGHWNRCHQCEKLLTEPEDRPGLCYPCALLMPHLAKRGIDTDTDERQSGRPAHHYITTDNR